MAMFGGEAALRERIANEDTRRYSQWQVATVGDEAFLASCFYATTLRFSVLDVEG